MLEQDISTTMDMIDLATKELARADLKFKRDKNVEWQIRQPVYRILNNSLINVQWFMLQQVVVPEAIFYDKEPAILLCKGIENSISSHKLAYNLYLIRILWERKSLAKSWRQRHNEVPLFVPMLCFDDFCVELRMFYCPQPSEIDFSLGTFAIFSLQDTQKFIKVIQRLFSFCCLPNIMENDIKVEMEEVKLPLPTEIPLKHSFHSSICLQLLKLNRFEEPFEFLFHQDHAQTCGFIALRTFHRKFNRQVILKIFQSQTGCFEIERQAVSILGTSDLQIPSLIEVITIVSLQLRVLVYDDYQKITQRVGSWSFLMENTNMLSKTLHGLHDAGLIHGAISHTNMALRNGNLILTNFCACNPQKSKENDKSCLKEVLKNLDTFLPLDGKISSHFYSLLTEI